MRTTITLDAEAQELVERAMAETKRSFKQVVNDAIKRQLAPAVSKPVELPPAHDYGDPLVDYTKAVQLYGELEDAEILRKMSMGK